LKAALVFLAAAAALASGCGGSTSSTPLSVSTGPAPWPSPSDVQQRVKAADIPYDPFEHTEIHYHTHLDIFVNGRPEPVAPSIGREDQSFFSALHTHTTNGALHIEAPVDQVFTLQMLFTEWGVRLSPGCIGEYCRSALNVAAYVDGKIDKEPLPKIALLKGREIALVIGKPPASIPATWDCLSNILTENPAECRDFGQ
jgi:hypothetical protein